MPVSLSREYKLRVVVSVERLSFLSAVEGVEVEVPHLLLLLRVERFSSVEGFFMKNGTSELFDSVDSRRLMKG